MLRILTLIVLIFLVLLASLPATAQEPKRELILYSQDKWHFAHELTEQGIRTPHENFSKIRLNTGSKQRDRLGLISITRETSGTIFLTILIISRICNYIPLIGERTGTTHHSYSVNFTVAKGHVGGANKVDHDSTKLVCTIADAALSPREAARETITIIREMVAKSVNSSRPIGSA